VVAELKVTFDPKRHPALKPEDAVGKLAHVCRNREKKGSVAGYLINPQDGFVRFTGAFWQQPAEPVRATLLKS